jgi:hypothetical protein
MFGDSHLLGTLPDLNSSHEISRMIDSVPNNQELYLERSLFDRLINGDGGFCLLNQQMRMQGGLKDFV